MFGSVARGQDRPDSDVDLLADFPPGLSLFGLGCVEAVLDAIRSHLQRGDLSDGLIFDAVRIRLLEIGEAVKALPDDLLATQPSIPWRQIARMRDLSPPLLRHRTLHLADHRGRRPARPRTRRTGLEPLARRR